MHTMKELKDKEFSMKQELSLLQLSNGIMELNARIL